MPYYRIYRKMYCGFEFMTFLESVDWTRARGGLMMKIYTFVSRNNLFNLQNKYTHTAGLNDRHTYGTSVMHNSVNAQWILSCCNFFQLLLFLLFKWTIRKCVKGWAYWLRTTNYLDFWFAPSHVYVCGL